MKLAFQALTAGDTLVVARLTRLGRSLAAITNLMEQLIQCGVRLRVGPELFDTLPAVRVLKLFTQFQVELVEQAIADADWSFERRDDLRPPHNRVDAVQSVWLHQLYDAGMPRFTLGEHFGVSRATAYRIADPQER